MINVAIVEDEKKMSDLLKSYFNQMMKENYDIIFSINIYNDALNFLSEYKSQFDLILMDIELPNLNGMDAAKKVRELDDRCTIMFVTYMAKFALKGYEVKAFDFVLKPVSYYSFSIKILKAVSYIIKNKSEHIMIETKDGIRSLYVSSIKYIEVSGHSLSVNTYEGVFHPRGSLSGMKKLLEPYHFLQCNVCYLVNPQHITLVKGNDVFIDKTKLRISRPKKKVFMKDLADYFKDFEGKKSI